MVQSFAHSEEISMLLRKLLLVTLFFVLLSGCSTFDPVPTGQSTYLIEGGVGLTGATFSLMASHANEFCEKKGLQMTVVQWSPWVPGSETPKLQFSCTTQAAPAHLRPDRGVATIHEIIERRP
jgi:hypothetical protein